MEDDRTFPQRASGSPLKPNPTTEATQRAAGPNFFRDGENVQFMWADKVLEHDFSDNVLRLKVRTLHQTHRTAQTHDSVMHQFVKEENSFGELVFEISFVTDYIFRVRYAGQQSTLDTLTDDPAFPPPEARMLSNIPKNIRSTFSASANTGNLELSTSSVRVVVQSSPFRLLGYLPGAPTPFWKQRISDLFTSDIIPCSIASHQGREAVFESFTLDPQEHVFGLGERFDSVERRGRPVDFVNHDAIGTSNTRTYINVPFFWSTNGYGCFLNSIARSEWDMGMSEAGSIGFCTEEKHMDYFILAGPSPREILHRYTSNLTGTAPMPPVWSFGLWMSRNSYQTWDVVHDIVKKADEANLPFDVVHLDTAWFQEDWNPDLKFGDRFPEPEKHMAILKEQGIRTSLWQYNFVPPREDNSLFVEAREGDFLGHAIKPDGTRSKDFHYYPNDTTGWKTDDIVIDFTNPEAADWYGKKIEHLIEQGASAIKTDFGDCIPAEASYLNIDGRRLNNLYSLIYNATVRKHVMKVSTDTAQWARSGTAGSQRYPVHWGGDSQCSWSALQGSLRATLSIGLSGFAFFSHDLGGFIGKPTPELYIRWAQLAVFSSHVRSHGAGDENGREPWFFGDQAVEIVGAFMRQRYRMLPYIIEQAQVSTKTGLPMVRGLVLEYPEDRNVWGIEGQYMFGSDLMVAPTLQPQAEASKHAIYLPAGTWYRFWDKKKIVSHGEWFNFDMAPLDRIYVFVKAGAMLCWASDRKRTFNQAGTVEKVEIYGQRDCAWSCGDGAGGSVDVIRSESGYTVVGREAVEVVVFE
jgi:alpha-D-xyloside xylohydrolase